MTLKEAIDEVVLWLDCVHIESAPARVSDAHETFHRSETLHVGPGTDNVRVSVHEAAHAVVGHAWGATIIRARVRTDGAGIVESEPDTALGHVAGTLAGPFSELFLGADGQRRIALAHSSDVLDAATAIASIPDMTNRSAATVAGCCVWEHWRCILRVADALEQFGELDGASIAAMCGRSQ